MPPGNSAESRPRPALTRPLLSGLRRVLAQAPKLGRLPVATVRESERSADLACASPWNGDPNAHLPLPLSPFRGDSAAAQAPRPGLGETKEGESVAPVSTGSRRVATFNRACGTRKERFPGTQYPLLPHTALWQRQGADMARIAGVSAPACPPLAGFRFPVPRSRFPALCRRLPFWQFPRPSPLRPSVPFLLHFSPIGTEVVHNGVWPCVHVTNHQIRVKIDQKGDVFRQKGIKKARISSCPS